MVDFNNETTIGTPAVDVERISILQRRYDLLEMYEDYKKKRLSGCNASIGYVQARLITMFLEIQSMIKRRKPTEYEGIKSLVFSEKIKEEQILEAIDIINTLLDEMHLTKIDNKEVYNKFRVEEENKVKGY